MEEWLIGMSRRDFLGFPLRSIPQSPSGMLQIFCFPPSTPSKYGGGGGSRSSLRACNRGQLVPSRMLPGIASHGLDCLCVVPGSSFPPPPPHQVPVSSRLQDLFRPGVPFVNALLSFFVDYAGLNLGNSPRNRPISS